MFLEDNLLEMTVTLTALGAGLGLAATAAILERRPRTSFQPRLIPTTPLMFAGILVALLAVIHVVNLMGIKTGR
jgi:hypothetical protein